MLNVELQLVPHSESAANAAAEAFLEGIVVGEEYIWNFNGRVERRARYSRVRGYW